MGEPEREVWRPLKGLRYAVGDRLWVRETHYVWSAGNRDGTGRRISYRATEPDAPTGWTVSIHMPRWASRLTLTVTGVKVERLNGISAADTIAEGVECETCVAMRQSACNGRGCFASIQAFRDLWNSINGPTAWEANPWVVAATFTVGKHNIDTAPPAAAEAD